MPCSRRTCLAPSHGSVITTVYQTALSNLSRAVVEELTARSGLPGTTRPNGSDRSVDGCVTATHRSWFGGISGAAGTVLEVGVPGPGPRPGPVQPLNRQFLGIRGAVAR